MAVAQMDAPVRAPLSHSLKEGTGPAHERLDSAIMDCEPFSSRDRYMLFLKAQHAFHRDIHSLYDREAVSARLPGFAGCDRLERIEQDMIDLGETVPHYEAGPLFASGARIDVPSALGWIYVAQGSNLGAAFLLKHAQELGLSETFGARHLAAAPEGRGLHWRRFTAALDAPEISEEEIEKAISGANAAFDRFYGLVVALYHTPR